MLAHLVSHPLFTSCFATNSLSSESIIKMLEDLSESDIPWCRGTPDVNIILAEDMLIMLALRSAPDYFMDGFYKRVVSHMRLRARVLGVRMGITGLPLVPAFATITPSAPWLTSPSFRQPATSDSPF